MSLHTKPTSPPLQISTADIVPGATGPKEDFSHEYPMYKPTDQPTALLVGQGEQILEKSAQSLSRPLATHSSDPPSRPLSRSTFLFDLVRTTTLWTVAGIAFMLLGIGLAHIVFRYRIYVCPGGAQCPGVVEPSNRVLQAVRTVMQYWLQIGMIVAGYGLTKLTAYQAWLSMNRQGNSIDVLDMNVGALKGSVFDAVQLLLLKQRNRLLGLFLLIQVVLTASITFIVGLSIRTEQDTGGVSVQFTYPKNVSTYSLYGPGRSLRPALDWIDQRVRNGDMQSDTLSGTLVVLDNRTTYAKNARAGGPQLGGTVTCVNPAPNVSVVTWYDEGIAQNIYNITYWSKVATSNQTLQTFEFSPMVAVPMILNEDTSRPSYFSMLWASSKASVFPDIEVMQTPDGKVHISLCYHSIVLSEHSDSQDVNPPHRPQLIQPSRLTGYHGFSDHDSCDFVECLSNYVVDALFAWWDLNRYELDRSRPSNLLGCTGGVLAPAASLGKGCRVNNATWSATVALSLSAVIQTSDWSGNATQDLVIRAESINRQQWWLQGLVPLSALLLYFSCLGYTLYVHRAGEVVKELNTYEVMKVGCADSKLHDLAQNGRLMRSEKVGGTGVLV